MTTRDTPSTSLVLFAFQLAWRRTIEDYEQRQINAEHCLQASLYRHLKNSLPSAFSVFSEAVVRLGENAINETGKQKVVIDLLVCEHRTIVAAIEIKYTPRGEPNPDNVRKDLTSLSHITNRHRHADRVKIEMPRFRQTDNDTLELSILSQRKLIFAAYCSDDSKNLSIQSVNSFWSNFQPHQGYWKNTSTFPPNLCISLAAAGEDGTAKPVFFGPAFDRIAPAVESTENDV